MSPTAKTVLETKRLNMNVPKGLHDAFKAATAAEGKQMTDVLMDFIRTYVQQHQPGRVRRGGRK